MEYLRKQIEQLKRGNAWLQAKVEEAEKAKIEKAPEVKF